LHICIYQVNRDQPLVIKWLFDLRIFSKFQLRPL
jgi:hypothetical protein